jgi:anthranilate phosphoribosyltransferase
VAKHGNRAVTSKCGSADVLEALGISTTLSPEAAARMLAEHQFAFLFAPLYHPAFKQIGPARKICAERGQRTLFNFLGPLLNPAHPSVMLIGTARPNLCEPMARVLQTLGVDRGMVVCGQAGNGHLDELSTLGENIVSEFYQENAISTSILQPMYFPIQPAKIEDLRGGDPKLNADVVCQILNGQERGPKRDAVCLNAAGALMVAGKVKTMIEGWEMAASLIDSQKAFAKLSELQKACKN